MADGKYSIDDILNEYSGSSEKKRDTSIDIDSIINGSVKSDESGDEPKITLHNTELFNKINESDVAAQTDDAQPYEDDFSKKYDKLSAAVTAVKEREKEKSEPYVPAPKPARSFSEKFEQTGLYGDEETREESGFFKKKQEGTEKKSGLSALFGRRHNAEASAEEEPAEAPIQSTVSDTVKAEDNPFEKFSAIKESETETPDEPKEAEDKFAAAFESKSEEKKLDDILNEYAEPKKKSPKNENTQHKSFTDFFTKLIPKSEDSEDGSGISGNTELIDGMLKAKKERMSRTQHVAPIERKSISDIDLNLDDKIIPDTAQIPVDSEQTELDKINALKERRSKKIKDFVLVGDEEDVSDEDCEEEEQPKVIEDFESFDEAPSIAHDIAQLKGSLMMRLVVLIICFVLSGYIVIANESGALPIMELLSMRSQTSVFLFVNAILGLLAAFSSYTVISCGLSKLVSMKADCDSLCAVSIVSSIAATMIMFANANMVRGSFVHIYIPVAIASLMFNTIGKLFIVSRTQKSFRFVSGSSEKYAVFHVSDEETAQSFTRGALNDFPNLAAMRKTEFLSEFLKTSYSGDSTDRFCRIFTPVVMVAAAVIGVIAGIMGRTDHGSSSVYIGISVFVGLIAICTGFSVMLIVNLPMLRASKKNSEVQGVVLGFDCIEEFAETNSILVDAGQLFPQGSVKLAAIKVFSDTRIDEAIVEAASLTTQAGSILKNMFYDIIAGKTELLEPVESYIFEDSMGLCGWINNKRVLLGNRELMINHSIEGMPPITKEKEYTENGRCAVYLSISGELSAMFLVEITPTMEVKQSLCDLQKNGIYVMIRSVDSIVSINRLAEMFEISPEYLKLIPFRVHEQFNEVTAYQVKQRATVACSGRFAALSSLIISCRNMHGTIGVGIGIQAVSMILAMLIYLVLVVIGSFTELSASMALMYNFVFTAVLVIFQMIRKN